MGEKVQTTSHKEVASWASGVESVGGGGVTLVSWQAQGNML